MFPWDDLGPTKSPLSVPPAMIVYVTPHCSPLTVTVTIALVIGPVPFITNVKKIMCVQLNIRHVYTCTYLTDVCTYVLGLK